MHAQLIAAIFWKHALEPHEEISRSTNEKQETRGMPGVSKREEDRERERERERESVRARDGHGHIMAG